MYVLLTTKPGEFKTVLTPGLAPVESYDYIFYGRKRARFTIAEIVSKILLLVNDDQIKDESILAQIRMHGRA